MDVARDRPDFGYENTIFLMAKIKNYPTGDISYKYPLWLTATTNKYHPYSKGQYHTIGCEVIFSNL